MNKPETPTPNPPGPPQGVDHYIVFDSHTGDPIELEDKLNELARQDYVLMDTYYPNPEEPHTVRFIMEHVDVRRKGRSPLPLPWGFRR